MTDSQLGEEWRYRYLERLGLLVGTSDPTVDQLKIALTDADQAIQRLESNDR